MKRKSGFTLIELLAVIVILAIIALIAVPIIMNIISEAKKGAAKDSLYGYVKAVELQVSRELLITPTQDLLTGTYTTQNGDLYQDGNKVLSVPFKGTKPEDGGEVTLLKGRVSKASLRFNGAMVTYDGTKTTIDNEGSSTEKTAVSFLASKNVSGNTEGLITDDTTDKNIRYAGSNSVVKNYVLFNDEMWRIVGIFNGRMKLVRDESIGSIAWNTEGKNDWATSSLGIYLNGQYFNGLDATAKNMVLDTTYYMGKHSDGGYVKKSVGYADERKSGVTTWTGKVGLLYPSDYGYAASSVCDVTLEQYSNTECTSNNWLYTGSEYWLITPVYETHACTVYDNGLVNQGYMGGSTTYTNEVRPTISLNANVKIISGNGTSGNPYILGM